MIRILILGLISLTSSLSLSGPDGHLDASNSMNKFQEPAPPSVSINPSALAFEDQVIGKPGKPLRVTVTNAGATPLYVNSAAISGDNPQDFGLSNDTCTGATIAPKKSCIIDITFTPSKVEARKAALTLTDNAPDSPQTVSLSGKGINTVMVPPSGRPAAKASTQSVRPHADGDGAPRDVIIGQ